MLIAARGLGKSWIISVYACARCILYPGTKVVIASGTKGQARLLISEKIEKELMQHPNLAREIKSIKTGLNDASVIFQNGSTIIATASNENARGLRCNVLICEEFRMIDKKILEDVLKPFLNVYRQPPYLKKEEYSSYKEENIELYISSAYYKSHWMWDAMKDARDLMVKGKNTFICAADYLLSIHHGLLSEERIKRDREKENMDTVAFHIEYENMMYGESEKAFFKLDDIHKIRTLTKPFYPLSNEEYLKNKDKRNKSLLPKKASEIRLIGLDIALMSGNTNDNSVFTLMRLLPNKDSFSKQVVYIEHMNGEHSEKIAIRLKQLFEDFECDYVVMDTAGNGLDTLGLLIGNY